MKEDFAGYIDVKEVIKKVNLTSAGIYARIKAGTFPAGVKIGSARVWTESEIDEWLAHRNAAVA
ncbi:MAG: AlpA family phage regulatory protein [Synergistaceae bacterium]|nr:AlpA family phage regulatory protein [Synergistaceae bacterium]